jgi:hypothetical protein
MAGIRCPQRTREELRKTSAGRPAPPGSGVSHAPGAVSVGPVVSDSSVSSAHGRGGPVCGRTRLGRQGNELGQQRKRCTGPRTWFWPKTIR